VAHVGQEVALESGRFQRLVSGQGQLGFPLQESCLCPLALGDIPRAAAAENVHANTLRYRLRRLVEVSGINLGDPDERLLLSLDLRTGELS